VIFKPIEIVDFRRQLKEFGLPERTIQHLSAVALDFREEMFVGADDVIETINGVGRAQESLVFCVCPRVTTPCSFLVRRTRNERIANFGCGAG
jgi:hypothetical protein